MSALVVIIMLFACEKKDISGPGGLNPPGGWLVPEEEVKGDLRPRELVEFPAYQSVGEMAQLDSGSLVLIYKSAGGVYVYPHNSMIAEVVNDQQDGFPFVITFCPKTVSGICWSRMFNGDTLKFLVSGYLYHDNLMPYEISTGSIWSQMLNRGVRGGHRNREASTFQLVETSWYNVETYFPGAHVFDFTSDGGDDGSLVHEAEKGFGAGEQSGQKDLKWVSGSDELPLGEQVFGIQGLKGVDIFLYSHFPDSIRLINFSSAAHQLVVVGSSDIGFITAFSRDYRMTAVQGVFPVIMEDESGSRWNIFGEAVSGPRQGERLGSPTAYFARGWAMQAIFKEDLQVYNGP